MKQRTKVMLSSLAAIAMSASLAVGATYALFTSDTQVDISVSSGTVSISATPKNLELYSKGVKQDGNTFEVGGTAKIVENVITIERMVPMDSVKFDIVIENYSNVNVQYRTIVKELEDTGLFPALKVSFSGRKTNKAEFEGASSYSDWALITPNDTDPTTAEPVQTVGVTIDFPDGEDQNKYQNTSCKLVVIVEAVQANADVYSGVAKIGGTAYETLEEALAKAQPNDVVELLHPGVYAPFTINTEGVTVKGIVGKNKLESTVFNVTGNNMINLMASETTIDSLWVEVLDGSTDWTAGAFNIVQSWGTGATSDDVTITNSRIYGNDKLNFAILCCNNTFTFTNNYVEGFPTAVSSMSDNGVAVNYTIANNTTNDVEYLVNGYWGKANTTGNTNIVVNNNVANDETLILLWDYAYAANANNETAINAQVKGNTNATLKVVRKANVAVVDTDETGVIYQNIVTLTGFADGKYTIARADGAEMSKDENKEVTVKNGTGVMNVAVGTYVIANETNVSYMVTVGQNAFAIDASDVAYYVTNDAQLLAAIDNEGGKTTAATIYLADGTYSADIYLTTTKWEGTTAIAATKQTGNLTFKAANGENANVVFTGTTTLGWFENKTTRTAQWNAEVSFENITFDHANAGTHSILVNSVNTSKNSNVVGKGVTLKNCTIIGDGEYGIGSASGSNTGVSKIEGCTFENGAMQVSGNFGTGLQIVGCTFNNSRVNVQGGNGVTIENCTFDATLTSAHVGDSFYMIRSNKIPMNIVGCKINIDSALTEVATAQAKWALLWSRKGGVWTVSDVTITTTTAAQAQTELLVTKVESTGSITCNDVKVNGNSYVHQ